MQAAGNFHLPHYMPIPLYLIKELLDYLTMVSGNEKNAWSQAKVGQQKF